MDEPEAETLFSISVRKRDPNPDAPVALVEEEVFAIRVKRRPP